MRLLQRGYLLLLLSFLVTSCKDLGVPPDYLNGGFDYTAYDMNGNQIGSGTLTLQRNDSTITGKKNIVGDCPESGASEIYGTVDKSGFVYLFLGRVGSRSYSIYASLINGKMEGTRRSIYYSFGGPLFFSTIGTFRAISEQSRSF